MWNYIIRRLFWVPFLLLVVSFISFMLFRLGPGDPVLVILGNKHDPNSQSAQNLREELGIDKPLMVQFVNYSINFFQGDFGSQIHHHQERYSFDYKLKQLCLLMEYFLKNHVKMKI